MDRIKSRSEFYNHAIDSRKDLDKRRRKRAIPIHLNAYVTASCGFRDNSSVVRNVRVVIEVHFPFKGLIVDERQNAVAKLAGHTFLRPIRKCGEATRDGGIDVAFPRVRGLVGRYFKDPSFTERRRVLFNDFILSGKASLAVENVQRGTFICFPLIHASVTLIAAQKNIKNEVTEENDEPAQFGGLEAESLSLLEMIF